ncbi:Oidioi.mRNA.OKI2018_I69.chr1.g3818.t1.cds [Oikopleura dioica]|uniref:Oidioi.mRNA.OKI2018_I69.chr1.g3818.t1.cds n=1 Tax=Oikopleura dioica TaxID=34765 RepID=A0ABN7T0U5_OIKDI|nr:Oidioi.mRNA.OKI2018_I69.chr1.g3818.t1.cds [Oikopleura dioica]
MTSSTDSFQNVAFELPQVDLSDLDFLAGLISPSTVSEQSYSSPNFAPSSGYNSAASDFPVHYSSSSSPSSSNSSPGNPIPSAAPVNASYYHYPSPAPSPHYSPEQFYPQQQYFFPSTFSPTDFNPQALQSSMNSYLSTPPSFHPSPQPQPLKIAKSALKNRRASRSKCPCLKCCHARANQIPSPTYHACVVKNCQKSYTRPAHLRSHLKSHDSDGQLKCDLCCANFPTSDLLISHMFEHGKQMKL